MNTEIATGFSNPFEPFDDEFLEAWIRVLHRRRIDAFLDRWAGSLNGASGGVETSLRRLTAWLSDDSRSAIATETVWHPFSNLAPIDAAETASAGAAIVRAVQCLLRAAESDLSIEASARFTRAVSLGFSTYRLPPALELSVVAAGPARHLALRTPRGWTRIVFERHDAGWVDTSRKAEPQPTVGFCGRRIAVFPIPRSIERADPRVVAPDQTMVDTLQAALDLIDRVTPAYRRWIARMLRVVVPLQPVHGRFDSETFAALSGTAFISLHPDVIRTAETLVHEVSHDYLHVLNTLDPLADATGAESFFSPARGCLRPALGILKAHHAFVNVLAFYYRLEMSGVPLESEYARGVAKLEAWRTHLENCLAGAQSVTEFGCRLWRPLGARADQLQALGACLSNVKHAPGRPASPPEQLSDFAAPAPR